MSDFMTAFVRTSLSEGGYNDSANDSGGETYRGVARNFNPDWEGWPVIDGLKGDSMFPDILADDSDLDEMIMMFYREEYWKRSRCDKMPQIIANEVYDNAVLMGVAMSGKILQKSLNVLNRNERDYPDIDEDGHVGPQTLRVMRICIGTRGEARLHKVVNLFQAVHILGIMMRDPAKEEWAGGWLDRVTIEVAT